MLNKPIIVLGDLNCNDLDSSCREYAASNGFARETNLQQLIKEPTRITDTTEYSTYTGRWSLIGLLITPLLRTDEALETRMTFLVGVIATNCTCVLQVPALSLCSRDEVMAHVFCTVELLVLESRVPYPHQIVQDNASFHDDFDSGGVMLHGSQHNPEAVRQDSEGIFNHPPGTGL